MLESYSQHKVIKKIKFKFKLDDVIKLHLKAGCNDPYRGHKTIT